MRQESIAGSQAARLGQLARLQIRQAVREYIRADIGDADTPEACLRLGHHLRRRTTTYKAGDAYSTTADCAPLEDGPQVSLDATPQPWASRKLQQHGVREDVHHSAVDDAEH